MKYAALIYLNSGFFTSIKKVIEIGVWMFPAEIR